MNTDKLSGVPETMLITLWAKAMEYNRHDALLRDKKAVEIFQRIDYDFSKFKRAKLSQAGCCIRASLIDKEIRYFLSQYPDAVVIQLGAGIDARYERLRPRNITHWYDLDVQEAIELRKKVLSETKRNTFLACSMFDYRWIDLVKSHRKPVLIVIEGVLMYFQPNRVKAFFAEICKQFEQATILFDMLAPIAVGRAKQHDSLKTVNSKVEFLWSELDSRTMEKWNDNLHFEKEYFLSDHEQDRFPWLMRILYGVPYFYKRFNQRIVRLRVVNPKRQPKISSKSRPPQHISGN